MLLTDVALAGGSGIALGAVTGMPIGVVNMAIVDAALRGEKRYASGIGIGGALADTVHAGLAFVGIGRLLEANPQWSRGLAIAAAVLILSYALFGARRIAAAKPRAGSGIVAGALLTLPNPAPLAAWAAIAAVIWPQIPTSLALVLAAGVGVGSATWFVLLARWSASLPRDGRVARLLPKLAIGLLVVVAVVGLARSFL